MASFLFAFKDNSLILVDPALVLHLTLNHMSTMNGSDNATDATHVKEEILADEAVIESANFVSDSDCHVCLRCNMRLISSYLQCIALIQVNLLILLSLSEEKFRLLT